MEAYTKYRNIAATVVLGVVVASTTYAFFLYQTERGIVFFSNTLQKTNVSETVQIGNSVYTIREGKVYTDKVEIRGLDSLQPLRLAYAKTVARRSPLISIAGTDPNSLDAAITQLEKTREALAVLQKNQSDSESIRTGLYPTEFLHALAEVERTRIAFLAQGTWDQKNSYEKAQKKAIAAYYKDLKKYRDAFIRVVPTSVGRYGTARDIVERDDIIAATYTLEQSMKKTESQLRNRSLCTRAIVRACNTSDTEIKSLPVSSEKTPSLAQTLRAREVESLLNQTYETKDLGAPIVYRLSESACVGAIEGGLLFEFYSPPSSSIFSEISPVYIGNIRFTDSAAHKDTPFYKYFFTQNVRYVIDDPLLHYKCTDVGTDVGKLFSLRSVYTFAHTTKLSVYAQGAEKDTLEKIENSEADISDPVSEKDVTTYINAAYSLIKNEEVPTNIKNDILTVSLQLKNNSASFDSMVRTIAEVEESNMQLVQKGVQVTLDATYLLYVRSAFTTLFLSHNYSAVGTPKRFFSENTLPKNEEPFVYYDTLKNIGLASVMERDISFFTQIHRTPSNAPTYIVPSN